MQFKVKLSKVSPFGDARAQLISILDEPDDIALNTALEKYKEPVEITHPKFGTLALNRSAGCFDGSVNWMGASVNVSLDGDEDTLASNIETLETLYGGASQWSKKITDYAVLELLDLKNTSWLMDGQQELKDLDFISVMKLESIMVYSDGEFEFWHSDGGLFWGHSILISGSLSEGPIDADIPG